MKKIPLWLIIVWIILFVVAIAAFVVGAAFKIPSVFTWTIALSCLFTLIVWVTLVIVLNIRKTARKTSDSILANRAIFDRLLQESEEAVKRYLDTVLRRGILRKSALFERPWFLLCGSKGSGKSSLLKGSGLHFPLRYPSERDGFIIEGSNQVFWMFANEGVWLDTPGAYMEEDNRDEWQAFIAALASVRSLKPVDGVAIVVNVSDVLNTDELGIKNLAQLYRRRIDELIAQWGIEFPVYLIFNKIDEVPGFQQYFREHRVRGQNQIFGATLSLQQASIPRAAFIEEFNLLCKSLTDMRIDKLVKERDESAKRMICRFVIHFESIQEKLASFVAEMFKPSSYEGKPIFRGFYFTSCFEKKAGEEIPEQVTKTNIGMTIANHPLNPRKMILSQSQKSHSVETESVQSMFVLPLFREIMVGGKELVTTTQKRSRAELARYYLAVASIVLTAVGVIAFMARVRSSHSVILKQVASNIEKAKNRGGDLLEKYYSLEMLGKTAAMLQHFEERGSPFFIDFRFYKGKKIYEALMQSYFKALHRLIVNPSEKYLEYKIREKVDFFGELDGSQYDDLYRALKAYLYISEAVKGHEKELDTIFLRAVLTEAVQHAILVSTQRSRLPQQVEIILKDNLALYLLYLKRGIYPNLIQGKQNLVSSARQRLQRLPSAEKLYQSIATRLSNEVPTLDLDKILGRTAEGILKSDKTISAIYTQQGWSSFIFDAISEASKNPYKIDWVIGITNDQMLDQSLDTKKLRQDMIDAYLSDVKRQWLDFLAAIYMEPFGDLKRCSRILQKLVGDGSELQLLLEAVAEYTVIKPQSELEQMGEQLLQEASKIKGLKKNVEQIEKTKKDLAVSIGKKTPLDDLTRTFDPLRAFSRSTSGSLSGYEGYKDKISTLVEKLNEIENQGPASTLVFFNGRENDPLLSSWKYTQSVLNGMPQELAEALKGILQRPVEYTGEAVSKMVSSELNKKWQQEIIKPFTTRLSGRYPFLAKADEAAFSEVMDFFRPSSGTFWGFYERVLSPFLVKNESVWMARPLGSLKVDFNPAIIPTLTAAERIRDVFFKPDGTLRTFSLRISSVSSNQYSSQLDIAGQLYELDPGASSAVYKWPVESSTQGATLKIKVSGNFSQELTYPGQWGLMKILQAATINRINSSSFTATWQVNVQNMYVIYLKYAVALTGSDHPFGEDLFSRFSCPVDLIAGNTISQEQNVSAVGVTKR